MKKVGKFLVEYMPYVVGAVLGVILLYAVLIAPLSAEIGIRGLVGVVALPCVTAVLFLVGDKLDVAE